MSENLDVIIAFVVVIIGLSMTLQLLTDMLKNWLSLRSAAYESLLKQLYINHFGASKDSKIAEAPTKMQGRLGALLTKLTSHDVTGNLTDRLHTFASKLKTLSITAKGLRTDLTSLRNEFALLKTDDEKLKLIASKLETSIPEISRWADRIRGLHPKTLLRIYQTLTKGGESDVAVKDDPNGGHDSSTPPIEKKTEKKGSDEPGRIRTCLTSTSDNLVALAEFVRNARAIPVELAKLAKATEKKAITKKRELVEGIETSLTEILKWATEFENKIGGIQARIEDNFDDAISSLENSYAKNLRRWCFGCGIVLCVSLNADAIMIFNSLRESSVLTQSIIQQQDSLTAEVASSVWGKQLNGLTEKAKKLRDDLRSQPPVQNLQEFKVFKVDFISLSDELKKNAGFVGESPSTKGSISIDNEKTQSPIIKAGTMLAGTGTKSDEAARLIDQGMGLIVEDAFKLDAGKVKLRVESLVGSTLPLGWNCQRWGQFKQSFWVMCFELNFREFLAKLFGIIATAFLISFGAPMWNDVLQSLLGVKGFLREAKQGKPKPSA